MLRPTAGSGKMHEKGTLVPPPAAKGALGGLSRIAGKAAGMSIGALEELELVPGTPPRGLRSRYASALV